MKQINLLPWREQQSKLKKRQCIIRWVCFLALCFIVLLITKLLIAHQIKAYQLSIEKVLFHLKALSSTIKKVERLKQEEKELKKVIYISQENHKKIRKILKFLIYLETILTPDLFIRIIEYHHPYLNFVMSAGSKIEVSTFIKALQLKYHQKIQWNLLNEINQESFEFVFKRNI